MTVVVDDGRGVESAWTRVRVRAAAVRPAWKALAAYLLYQALAFGLLGFHAASRFSSVHVGIADPDSSAYRWFLTWTPWAISHQLNPVHTGSVFAPDGVSLSWTAFIPGPALVMWPITRLFGSLASLNLLLVAAPALAGWAAYLVCHRVTHRFWASVAGGYLFGFSAYLVANVAGFVNLALVFPIPLLVYLVIRDVEGSVGPVSFVAGFTALLVGLFSISTELFGTAAIFGAIAFGGAFLFAAELRRRMVRTAGRVLLSGALAAILLIPYLIEVLRHTPPELFRELDKIAAADLSSFVVPPRYELLGGNAAADLLSRLTAYPRSNSLGYVGIAVLATIAGYAITERRRRETWPLVGFVGLVWLLTLGHVLRIGGHETVWLPASLLGTLGILQQAIPVRFAVYASLAIALIAALWLSRAGGRWGWVRWVIVGLSVVSLLPRPTDPVVAREVPAFVSSGQVRDVLRRGENVYVIPRIKGDEMLWQSDSDFWFRLAQGYVGPVPSGVDPGPMADGLHLIPSSSRPSATGFATWLRDHDVTAVVLDDRARRRYGDLLSEAGLAQVFAGGGVSVWRPPAAGLTEP